MSDADTLMWTVEKDPTLRSTVVTVLTLDRGPDWDALVDRVERGSRLIPRLRQRVVTPMWRVGPPCWSADPQFDLSYHLRRVRPPEPGSFECVLDLARNAAMAGFDRARPLWEYAVVDGLEGGGAALVLKVRRSITDGVGGMKMLMMLFDLERTRVRPGRATNSRTCPRSPRSTSSDARSTTNAGAQSTSPGTASETQWVRPGARRDREGALQEASRVTRSLASFLAPATTPRSPIIGARSLGRRLTALDVPLDDLKHAAKGVGGSLNDAFLAAVVGGVQRYHQLHGVEPAALRMVMPINLRGEGTALGGITSPRRVSSSRSRSPTPRSGCAPSATSPGRHTTSGSRSPTRWRWCSTSCRPESPPRSSGPCSKVRLRRERPPRFAVPAVRGGRRLERLYPFGPLRAPPRTSHSSRTAALLHRDQRRHARNPRRRRLRRVRRGRLLRSVALGT